MDPAEFEVMAAVERNHPWFVNRRRLVAGLVKRFASQLGQPRILDAGCGTGGNLGTYGQIGRPVGVECELEAARISNQSTGRPVAVGDLRRLPFRDATFDVVICTDVIEHIENDVDALCEMRRVLAPAGRILITTPAYSWAYTTHDRQLHHERRYDLGRLWSTFRSAGLMPLHISRYNVALALPLLAMRWLNSQSSISDVGRPVPRILRPVLDAIWHLEASLASRLNLLLGLTHVAVLARRDDPLTR